MTQHLEEEGIKEKSRAKERIFSFRNCEHRWDPKSQRPELWSVYNTRIAKNESMRVFPLSNWTELDIWQYIYLENIEIVPLYFAKLRPTVIRDGLIIMVDDNRFPIKRTDEILMRSIRFRTLGCYPLTGAIESNAKSVSDVIRETLLTSTSERQGRTIDKDQNSSLEQKNNKVIFRCIIMNAKLFKTDPLISKNIEEYLKKHQNKSLLRFITCGSVDDGKSTLIGRLLYDSKMIFEDQLKQLREDSKKLGTNGKNIDFALLVDGLAAEREQGITIDVAYRYFNTEKRKFIVADTPGHEQYTRNMVTGASTAELAIILVDARKGILDQTKRHTYLCHLLGIKNFILAINKMDLVKYEQNIFVEIKNNYNKFLETVGIKKFSAIPISAFKGDNITNVSKNTFWYKGSFLFLSSRNCRVRP